MRIFEKLTFQYRREDIVEEICLDRREKNCLLLKLDAGEILLSEKYHLGEEIESLFQLFDQEAKTLRNHYYLRKEDEAAGEALYGMKLEFEYDCVEQEALYAKEVLPVCFPSFCKELDSCLKWAEFEFLEEERYMRSLKKEGKEQMLEVELARDGLVLYLTYGEERYQEGDSVVVPDEEGGFEDGRVERVFYAKRSEIFHPKDDLRSVVRKCGNFDTHLYTPEEWLNEFYEYHWNEAIACEYYLGALREEQCLEEYLKNPLHIPETEDLLKEWRKIRKSLAEEVTAAEDRPKLEEVLKRNS